MGIRTKVWRPGVDPNVDFNIAGRAAIDGPGKRFLLDDPLTDIDVTADITPAWTTAPSSVFSGKTAGLPGASPHRISKPIGNLTSGTYTLLATIAYTNGASTLPMICLNLGGDGAAYNASGVISECHNFSTGFIERHKSGLLYKTETTLWKAFGTGGAIEKMISQNRSALGGFDGITHVMGLALSPENDQGGLLPGAIPVGDPSIQVRNLQGVGDYEITNLKILEGLSAIIDLQTPFILPDNFKNLKRFFVDMNSWEASLQHWKVAGVITGVDYPNNILEFVSPQHVQGFPAGLGGILRIEGTDYKGRVIGDDQSGTPVKINMLEPLPGAGTDLVGHIALMGQPNMAPCIARQPTFGFFYPLRADLNLEQTIIDYGNLVERPASGPIASDTNFPDINFAAGDNFHWKVLIDNFQYSAVGVPYAQRTEVREVAIEFDTTEAAACVVNGGGA